MVRLLICDDSAEARELVRTLLATQIGIEIVGEAANGEEAITKARELEPDVVLMDVAMPLLDGVRATRRIRRFLPATRIVAFAGSDDADVVMAIMEAGASAYCVKGGPPWELGRAIVGAGDPLVRLAQALARSVGESVKAELVSHELAELTGAAHTAVYFLSQSGEPIAAGSAGNAAGGAGPAELDAACRACTERALVHHRGVFAFPLLADDEPLGALTVAPGDRPKPDTELLASVADLAAASLASERRLALARAEARLDVLTGLPNRRAFEERLEDLSAELRAAHGELTVVLLDLDDFKQVNDTRGHAAGDEVLRRIGVVLRRTVRADEDVFRVGGEEFAVVLEGGLHSGLIVAERARAALRADRRGQPLPTLSAGVAALPDGASTTDDLLRRADAALYAAKHAGKDRVLAYGSDAPAPSVHTSRREARPNVLLVDDDPGLRALLRATVEPLDVHVEEAGDAAAAAEQIAAHAPDAIVLDVLMPGLDGIAFCRQLKSQAETKDVSIVLLTGADGEGPEAAALEAGADAFLRKPFSPLELLTVVERLVDRDRLPIRASGPGRTGDQVLLYAQDLGRLLEIERGQRTLLQDAYKETVAALAAALESKDISTRAHSQRVQRYALQLAEVIDPRLLDDPSLEYGFLLHDIGKIGIPDRILLKPGSLTASERGLMQTHTVLGEQMLGKVALLQGEGLRIVRSHHERWDGRGYPDELQRDAIPLGARIFAVADTLDAMTSDRPYRSAGSWESAVSEIAELAGRQFDPAVVDVFKEREQTLRRVYYELAA
jgi:diguanylate cyclase (GGDEF)-like protein